MDVVDLGPEHVEDLVAFFADLPEGDLTFIKEDVLSPDVLRSWAASGAVGHRWIARPGPEEPGTAGAVAGFLAVRPLPGWSDHVGEIRLVVHPAHRGTGLGRALARHALVRSVEAGLSKLVVEVVADQEPALALFTALGFTGEALLHDHIRDRDGQLRDLVVLSHHVGATWSGMSAVGLPDALDEPA